MSKNIKLGLIIFNLVILSAFHRGDALECYVCHGEDNCVEDYPSEICIIPDETTTESSEEETTSTDSPKVTSSTITEAEVSSTTIEALSTTTEVPSEAPSTTTEVSSEAPSTTTEDSSKAPSTTTEDSSEAPSTTTKDSSEAPSTTTEDLSEATSLTSEDSSAATSLTSEDSSEATSLTPETPTESPEPEQESDEINKSINDNYSVKQLYRDNVRSRRRRFALSTREESWSCFKSVEGEKVIERGCINGNPPKDSTYELCQSDKCNPASKIYLNFKLISTILTLTIAYYIF